jgi:hypothetical protein
MPLIMLNIVVFPEPFGPMMEKIEFFSTPKLILLTAFSPPKLMHRSSTLK